MASPAPKSYDPSAKSLFRRVALVTGATRGVGLGIARALGEAGATVIITGRTTSGDSSHSAVRPPGNLGETVEDAAKAATEAGGLGIPEVCDHTDDAQVEALFRRIASHGPLEILVNCVWGGYEHLYDGTKHWEEAPGFWNAPISRWDASFRAGVRAHYMASHFAARGMVSRKSGLIVNISFFAGQRNDKGVVYVTAKAADDRMAASMAHELAPHGVACVSLYPGLVKTESVMRAAQFFDLSNAETPLFVGRAVAALASDREGTMARTGQVVIAAQVAQDYGYTDEEGKRPRLLTIDEI
jgi:dehydrogenase/reductase SDR family protein 1